MMPHEREIQLIARPSLGAIVADASRDALGCDTAITAELVEDDWVPLVDWLRQHGQADDRTPIL